MYNHSTFQINTFQSLETCRDLCVRAAAVSAVPVDVVIIILCKFVAIVWFGCLFAALARIKLNAQVFAIIHL